MKNLKWFALIMSVIIDIAILPLIYWFYNEFYVKPFVQTHLSTMNYQPFFATGYGIFVIAMWIVVSVPWIVFGLLKLIQWSRLGKKKSKVKRSLIAALLALIIFSTIVLYCFKIPEVKARWNTWDEVDVLCLADEEFMAHPDWVTNAENVLQSVNDERFADSKIAFYIRGWQNWDSNDGCDGIYNLYQEGIHECGLPIQWTQPDPIHVPGLWGWGFISGSEWVDAESVTWWIDCLLIFTGQQCDTNPALGTPWCNAVIFRYDAVDFRRMTHELGHQYYLEHCGDAWCVMNVAWQFGDNFCSNCRAKLNANRDKWMTDPEVFFGLYYKDKEGKIPDYYWEKEPGDFILDYDGKILVLPNRKTFWGWGNWMRIRCGTLVTLHIVPNPGFAYNYTYVGNHQPIFVQNPDEPSPPSILFYTPTFNFCMNDTWTFAALFYETENCDSFGGRIPYCY